MKAVLFFIKALSNLHVGSGEINYGLVDNLIQRDPVTGLPTINSSSLKGALREHFEKFSDKKLNVTKLFGSEPKASVDKRNPGSLRFFDADLVGIPVRTTGCNFPFVDASAKENLSRIWKRLDSIGIKAQYLDNIGNLPKTQNNPNQKVRIEDLPGEIQYATTGKFEPIVDERIAIVQEKELDVLCNNEHLPVISRNCLEDGISTNLFYEQVLPRYTRLCTVIMGPEDELNAFCEALQGEVVQIGGNATIGYGYCQFLTYNNEKK
jgi:CRISPR-associated protein Cmr4